MAALGVVTLFAGSATAVDLGGGGVSEEGGDAVDVTLDTETSDSGGGGSGRVAVESEWGGADGSGAVAGGVEDQSLTVAAAGEGGPAGDEVGGGIECAVSPDSAQNRQEACEVDSPGAESTLSENSLSTNRTSTEPVRWPAYRRLPSGLPHVTSLAL